MRNLITTFLSSLRPKAAPDTAPRPHALVDAGQLGRRLAAIPSVTQEINTLIRTYGRTAVARSRYLCANNAYAISAKEAFVSAVAGFGVKPSSLITNPEQKKKLQQLWLDWVSEADADGNLDFYGMQRLGAGEMFEAGEFFLVKEDAPAGTWDVVPRKYRMVPAEMLPYQYNLPATSTTNRISMGIEFEASGRRAAYHFYRQHPGDNYPDASSSTLGGGYIRIPAENVIHVFEPVRIGQLRGIPHTLGSLITLAMLDLYDDAEAERKRVAALFGVFVTRQPEELDDSADGSSHPLGTPTGHRDGSGNQTEQFGLEPGTVVDLNPGENIEVAAPGDVGQQYEAFQYRNLLRAAAGMRVPYFDMTGDPAKANYGSMRAGLVAFKRRVTALQHTVLVHQLLRPVWRDLLDLATFLGLSPWGRPEYVADRREFTRVKWIPPKWDWVDPLKDRQAEKLAVDNGFKSRSDVQEEEGYDPEEVDDRIAADQQRAEDLGIVLNTGATPPSEDPAAGAGDGGNPSAQDPKETPDNG